MSTAAWLQLVCVVVLIAITTPLLGSYMAKVFSGKKAPGDRVFGPVERAIFRVCGVDPEVEQRWSGYAVSALAFSLVSVLVMYGLMRLQGHLPFNPDHQQGVKPVLSFNTAVSFLTNTNWQNYAGESTMSHLTQMAGLAVHNFVSAAAGLAVAIAFIRGLTRRNARTLGNFWVDLTRGVVRVLLPISFVFALVFVAHGMEQNFHASKTVNTVAAQGVDANGRPITTQSIPGGPVASQEAIKELGTNGGGFFNVNSAHPFENPDPITNTLEIWLILSIPFSLTFTFGKMAKDSKQGWAVFSAMFALWMVGNLVIMPMEAHGNPHLSAAGINQRTTAVQSGGNMEGKEVRFGTAGSGLFGNAATSTSTGAANSAYDSYTPLGGGVLLTQMMFGEVDPGGVGSGLYGMLIFALLAVFIAGLMVGRTPEYLGKKIQAAEMKLVVLYILFVPAIILCFAATAIVLKTAVSGLGNPGHHGLTEIVYAYVSQANNNGSAFGGLTTNTQWFNVTGALAMLIGRFMLFIPTLAIAGSLSRKRYVPESLGTFPTGTPLFSGLLTGVVVIVVGLTYFPVLALGPIAEHLVGKF
jgi:K+-transporting ATPase ATPase A chain